ncbi:MAG: type II toxin-antitoxin system VapC family toxin [Alphaproteobacteria bacterium]
MTVVLDTHSWIWFLNADPRLGRDARTAIEAATLQDGAVLSAISLWEISMLVARGRLTLPRDPREWLEFHLASPGFTVHPLSIAVAVGSNRLPADPHGDPADRIIIATARHLDAPQVTADQKILSYAKDGHVKALDARS